MDEQLEEYYKPTSENTHKQVIVMRKDLKMRTGKMIAQGAHASMKAILDFSERSDATITIPLNDNIGPWLGGLFTKIAVSVNSADELHALVEKAIDLDIPYALILDSGKTEFNGVPTFTCCAIGPAPIEVVDQITKGLPLL